MPLQQERQGPMRFGSPAQGSGGPMPDRRAF
jgi:hypothetical protein